MEYDDDYYYIPKILFKDDFYSCLTATDVLVYSVLRGKQIEAVEKGWIDAEGNIYLNYNISDLAKMFSCGRGKMIDIMRRLEECNLIERERVDIFYGNSLPYMTYINEV
ncbi:TPA: replication initiator protein A [Streptococcus agalactiae]|uniref:replication initiator protein A n=1 Tax=Streptococcus agalactiae TaxID=1311 RepID=UPI00036F18A1|nr:replication initiator protein A [Streptococcus agalactiae]HEN0222398.1 replication initiator protein A [Streptococcus agalactiae]HEN0748997.1 replication initiator protein A [Streptococcus agalactiae]HEN1014766.1 replication initiator protein A [Streptococcus agalactiae]HEN4342378.1 replication initiator protein A [Streptococcus agalactiae]